MILELDTNAVEPPMTELQQHVNTLEKLNLVVSRLPMQRIQDLQVGLLQEIHNRGEKEHHELMIMLSPNIGSLPLNWGILH
jgi:hypothetical protein